MKSILNIQKSNWLLVIVLVLFASFSVLAQEEKGMVIGDLILDPSAIVEMQSDDRGLLIPRMNTLQRDNNIQNPAEGLLIFNEDVGLFNKYFGGEWTEMDNDWIALPNATDNEIYHLGKVSVGIENSGNTLFGIYSNPAIADRTFTVGNATDGHRDFSIESDGRIGVVASNNASLFNIKSKGVHEHIFSVEDENSNVHFRIGNDGDIAMGTSVNDVDLSIKGRPENSIKVLLLDDSNQTVFSLAADLTIPNRLFMNGDAFKPGGGDWAAPSDRRLKRNIKPYREGLDFINKVNPVWFTYNGLANTPDGAEYIGVIAQELQEVAPHMIEKMQKDENGTEYLSVDPSAFTYMLINAVQEQQKEIESLESKYEDLLKRVEALEQQ